MKVITDFFTSIGDERAPGQIPPKTLTVLWLDSSWVYSKRMVLLKRELKHSEDVQDALIEDYFRYNDLSRMEADDILMNISEIESPNYEYVELDLLNLPRDLSTNLNEDSNNQKENVVPNKRFRMVTDEETGVFFRGKFK